MQIPFQYSLHYIENENEELKHKEFLAEAGIYPRIKLAEKLVNDIYINPHKYKFIFDNIVNLKILNYLEMCNRMDNVPYYSDFELIHYIDGDSFNGENYPLSDMQFKEIVKKRNKIL